VLVVVYRGIFGNNNYRKKLKKHSISK